MYTPDRRQFVKHLVLSGVIGSTAIMLSGCITSDILPSEKPKASKSKPKSKIIAGSASLITTATHISRGAALTSAYRAKHNLGPVSPSAALRRAAEGHVIKMARTGQVKHKIGLGDSFPKRLFAANYDARIAGENIAGGFDTIEQAMVGWQNSPGHKKILLKPRVTEIGIGVARNLTTGLETYWVMVLALPDSAPR